MSKEFYSVVKSDGGGWAIVSDKKKKVTKSYSTKKQALEDARNFSNNGFTVIVHGADGKISEVHGLREKGVRIVRTGSKLKAKDINLAIAAVMENERGAK